MDVDAVDRPDPDLDFQPLRLELEPQSITNSIGVAPFKKIMEPALSRLAQSSSARVPKREAAISPLCRPRLSEKLRFQEAILDGLSAVPFWCWPFPS